MDKVTVVDYGLGNLFSVQRSLEICGVDVEVTSDIDKILSANKVVLPGVGAFSIAINELTKLNLVPVIQEVANSGIPLLGICLGMQLLMDESEEYGRHKGLGLIPGKVVHIPSASTEGNSLKLPHIGWSSLYPFIKNSFPNKSLLSSIEPGEAVYFVHSYMALPNDRNQIISNCKYGGHEITAVIQEKNIYGCQFHPEKSGEVGLKILKEFCQSKK